jgi:sarcosine oxidase
MRTEYVVIGAGLTGLAAAWALTRKGREVLLIEQAQAGHQAGGSHGSCRIFRLGYEHPEYVSLAIRARQTWTELEQECGQRLLDPAPQLTFGPQMPEVQVAMEQAGAPFEMLPAEQAAERFPGVITGGPVLLETASAVIAADRALAALAATAAGGGARIWPGTRVTGLADDGRLVTVATTAGDIEAGCAIVCAGPWTAGLLATAGVQVPGTATLEQVAYLAPAGRGTATGMPIFVHYGGEFPYGLPVPGSDRYKIGIHHGGPVIDPDDQSQAEDAGLSRRIEAAAQAILPGFQPRPLAVERCVYDNSPDTDFVVDRIGNVVIGSGTSGHGFKFGPMIGEWLAFLAMRSSGSSQGEGTAGAPPARFALSRF